MTYHQFKKYVKSRYKNVSHFNSNGIQHTAWINELDITVYGSSVHDEIQEYRPFEKKTLINYNVN